ncbi:MAG: DUF1848 domain-containing protein, partial [Chloroflexota bacterium]|nr:DUF1848 domain-containing protein [Chloroflexota bacterium]
MIISASRRTDIPAFYAQWFMNRVRAGYCTVPNPYNREQVSRISLHPEDVAVIVFWTRHPPPLFKHLRELDQRGFKYYFHYTVLDNPRTLDRRTPALVTSIEAFRALADTIGPDRVIWRYDPIVFSNETPVDFHLSKYEEIAFALKGYTSRSVISILDIYRSISHRLESLEEKGLKVVEHTEVPSKDFCALMTGLVEIATANDMEIASCAEPLGLERYGIMPGKCIDDVYIRDIFGIQVTDKKDPYQREACGCVVSKDIGMYETCLFGCQYCYATRSFDRARQNYREHDPQSPSLIGWYEA